MVRATTVSAASLYGATVIANEVSASSGNFKKLIVTSIINATATTTFGGNIKVGGSAASRGSVLLTQQTTILSNNSAGAPIRFLLPTGSNMVSYNVSVEVPFGHAGDASTAARVTVYLGTGAATAASVIFEEAVSASGHYVLGNPGLGLASLSRNITATVHTNVSLKATGSAATLGQAIASINYVASV